MAKRKAVTKKSVKVSKKDLDAIERAAKRQAQKEAGALDGRFRTKKQESKKDYSRKRKDDEETED